MRAHTKAAWGIDVGARRISAALVLKTDQGVRVLAAGTDDLTVGERGQQVPPEKILSRLLRRLGRRVTSRGVPTAVTVSTGPVVMRLLDLSRPMPTNIREFVAGELKQCVGLSGRSISSDFCGVGGAGSVKRVLAVAADAGPIGETLRMCRAARMAVASVEPAALACARTLLTGEKNLHRSERALVAVLSHHSLVVFLFRKGVLDFVRVREVPIDTDPPAMPAAWLAEELNAVLAYCRTDAPGGVPGCQVRVVVHESAFQKSDVEHLPGLDPWVESFTVADSCGPILTGSMPAQAAAEAPSPTAVGAALGLLDLSPDDLRIDLTPHQAAQAKSYERHLLIAANVAALVIVGLFLVVQLLVRTTDAMDRRIEQTRLDGQLYTASTMVVRDHYVDDEIARIQSQLAGLQALRMRQDPNWPAILRSVDQARPAGISITNLAYGEDRTLLLRGTSPSREQVERLRQNLDGDEALGDAWLMSIERREDDNALEFEIHCRPNATD